MNMPALVSAAAVVAILVIPAAAQDRINPLGNGVAPMATTGPQLMIYRVAGVRNTPEFTTAGAATVFFCHSNSPSNEILRLRVFNYDGAVVADRSLEVSPRTTWTLSTHLTAGFTDNIMLSEGISVSQGGAAIISTSREIYCSAMLVDAGAAVPSGIALHMVRFNPAPGSVE